MNLFSADRCPSMFPRSLPVHLDARGQLPRPGHLGIEFALRRCTVKVINSFARVGPRCEVRMAIQLEVLVVHSTWKLLWWAVEEKPGDSYMIGNCWLSSVRCCQRQLFFGVFSYPKYTGTCRPTKSISSVVEEAFNISKWVIRPEIVWAGTNPAFNLHVSRAWTSALKRTACKCDMRNGKPHEIYYKHNSANLRRHSLRPIWETHPDQSVQNQFSLSRL